MFYLQDVLVWLSIPVQMNNWKICHQNDLRCADVHVKLCLLTYSLTEHTTKCHGPEVLSTQHHVNLGKLN